MVMLGSPLTGASTILSDPSAYVPLRSSILSMSSLALGKEQKRKHVSLHTTASVPEHMHVHRSTETPKGLGL